MSDPGAGDGTNGSRDDSQARVFLKVDRLARAVEAARLRAQEQATGPKPDTPSLPDDTAPRAVLSTSGIEAAPYGPSAPAGPHPAFSDAPRQGDQDAAEHAADALPSDGNEGTAATGADTAHRAFSGEETDERSPASFSTHDPADMARPVAADPATQPVGPPTAQGARAAATAPEVAQAADPDEDARETSHEMPVADRAEPEETAESTRSDDAAVRLSARPPGTDGGNPDASDMAPRMASDTPRRTPVEPAEPLVLRNPLPRDVPSAERAAPALPGPVLVSLRGVHADEGRAHVLKGVDLDVGKEGITAVLGPEGAGKSALLRAMAGHTRVSAGSIRVGGEDIAGLRSDAVARHGIRYLPPTGGAFAGLSVVENLRLAGRGSALARDRCKWLMRSFRDLSRYAKWPVARIPSESARLVAVVRALAAPKRLYLLDRPFTGLPAGAAATLAGVLRDLRLQGTTIVLTGTESDGVLDLVSDVALVVDGRVVWTGDTETFLCDATLARAAFGPAEART